MPVLLGPDLSLLEEFSKDMDTPWGAGRQTLHVKGRKGGKVSWLGQGRKQ